MKLKCRKVGYGLTMSMLFSITAAWGQRTLSTPDASPEAKALYCYIQSIAGKKILSGQMWSGWGFDELKYISDNTGGKQPAILGLDFIQQSVNNTQVTLATNWWKKGGIPTMMWHMGAPGHGEGYESSKMSANINNCLDKNTAEGKIFWADLAQKADLLQKLRDAKVPILWRPFHELSGNWFWWSKEGGAQFKKLWIAMYDYYVKERKLNNLIWVLCYSGEPNSAFFPGNQYVDIAGGDEYASTNSPQLALYNRVKNSIGGNSMPICLHECGIPPNPANALSTGEMWSWWMIWHTSFVQNMDKTYLKTIFNHDVILTLDELPKITACGTVTTGLEEPNNVEEMTLSPSPCNELLKVNVPAFTGNSYSVSIYTLAGALVSKETSSTNEAFINTSKLAPDMYLLKISTGATELTKKFIKVQ